MKVSIVARTLRSAFVMAAIFTLAGGVASARARSISADPILDWCNDSITILNSAEENARMVYSRGRVQEAKSILMNGLAEASAHPPGWGSRGPVTMLAIQRVKKIATAVNAEIASDVLGDRTSAVYLFRGYQFIRDVALELDQPFYIPYYYGSHHGGCRDRCRGFDIEAFERAFVRYSAEQLESVVDSLTLRGPHGDTPLGAPRAVLKALQIAAAASAYDLRNSLWAANFSCEIRELNQLSGKISAFLAGNRSLFRNEPEAFYATTTESRYLSHRIASGQHCTR